MRDEQSFAETAAQALTDESLLSLRAFHAHQALILDPLLGDAAETYNIVPNMDMALINPPMLEARAELMPAMLALEACSWQQRADMATTSQQRLEANLTPGFSALLGFSASFGPVLEHLKARAILRDANDVRWLMRLNDPVVMHQLRRILSSPELQWLMGPIRRWTYVLDGRWHSLSSPDVRAATGLSHVSMAPLTVSGCLPSLAGSMASMSRSSACPAV